MNNFEVVQNLKMTFNEVDFILLSQPESDSAIGQHLLESNQCARNYSDSQFKILTTARSQFHLSLLEAVYISRIKPDLCRQKQFVFTLQLFR